MADETERCVACRHTAAELPPTARPLEKYRLVVGTYCLCQACKKMQLFCSFCGKSHHEVEKLIAGPTVFICDECTELCMDIIREERALLARSEVGGGCCCLLPDCPNNQPI